MISIHSKWASVLSLLLLINAQVRMGATEPAKCYQCDSETDAKCITGVTSLESKACSTDTQKCFTALDDSTGKISRGCREKDVECKEPNCLWCDKDENDCNKQNICKKCDSEKNKDCAQTESSAAVFNSLCKAADTKCLITVKDNKHLERRCATADDIKACADKADSCKACDGGNCNTGVFPSNRKLCYQCASTDTKCGDVAGNSDTIKSLPCLLYKADDECYAFGSSDTSMTRGCVSDTDTNVNKCSAPKDNTACTTCTTNNCNNQKYKHAQAMKCVRCTSTKEDGKCLWSQGEGTAKSCKNDILYNQEELCYTQFVNGIAERGCLYDRSEAQGECKKEECVTCGSGDACNSKEVGFNCIRCRSDLEPKCKNSADKLTGGPCRNVVTEETSGCFHGIWNGIVIRGCMVDADERMQYVCKDKNSKQCTTCTGVNCNNAKTSGAAANSLTMGLLATILLTLWRLQ